MNIPKQSIVKHILALLLAPFLLLALFLGYARATEEAALVKDSIRGRAMR